MTAQRLCMLGCGNLGTPILSRLLSSSQAQFTHYTACVSSASSSTRLTNLFAPHISSKTLNVVTRDSAAISAAISAADTVILAVDPSQVSSLVSNPDIQQAFQSNPSTSTSTNTSTSNGKLLISVVAGLSVARLANLLSNPPQLHILRALPNVCALVSRSHTAIELPASSFPAPHLETATWLFDQIGSTQLVPAALLPAATAVGGSTPAFWAVIVDAMVDAAVAGGMPREMAKKMVVASMRGSAEMMTTTTRQEGQGGGLEASALRDMGTSPAGCTIEGIMVLEEMGVRAGVGKALRESMKAAGKMEGNGE